MIYKQVPLKFIKINKTYLRQSNRTYKTAKFFPILNIKWNLKKIFPNMTLAWMPA